MTPNELAERVNRKAQVSLRFAAVDTANRMHRRTPANRKKTRRALYVQVNGTKARVGLRFSKRYPPRGTETQKRFAEQWTQIRPIIRAQLINHLNEILKGN